MFSCLFLTGDSLSYQTKDKLAVGRRVRAEDAVFQTRKAAQSFTTSFPALRMGIKTVQNCSEGLSLTL